MILTIITFIIVFGILVFVHEFGHFYFAKRSGILVREFSIGMGPKLFSYHKNGTTYNWRILPLGGYVRMAGLDDDDDNLKKGMPITLILDENNVVRKINMSNKKILQTGLPLVVTDWDLKDKLFIKGYENGDEDHLKTFKIFHNAMIIDSNGNELQIAPMDVRYQSVSPWKRLMTNFAGPMNNFLLAIVAFSMIAIIQHGVSIPTNSTTIGNVETSSPAFNAGLKSNDKILKINNKKIYNWQELVKNLQNKDTGKKIILTIDRNGKVKKFNLIPKIIQENGKKVGQIGITEKMKIDHSAKAIIFYGFIHTWNVILLIFTALIHMFTHKFSLNELGGPVAMYSLTSQAAHYGFLSVVNLTAFLSINLGIMNLLPIPALDGGKILLNFIEGIRRKPIDPRKEMALTMLGFIFLLILMILVTWNDIRRYFF